MFLLMVLRVIWFKVL